MPPGDRAHVPAAVDLDGHVVEHGFGPLDLAVEVREHDERGDIARLAAADGPDSARHLDALRKPQSVTHDIDQPTRNNIDGTPMSRTLCHSKSHATRIRRYSHSHLDGYERVRRERPVGSCCPSPGGPSGAVFRDATQSRPKASYPGGRDPGTSRATETSSRVRARQGEDRLAHDRAPWAPSATPMRAAAWWISVGLGAEGGTGFHTTPERAA